MKVVLQGIFGFAPFPRAFYTKNPLLLNLHKNAYVYSFKVLILNKVPSRISGLYFLVYCRKEAIKNLKVSSEVLVGKLSKPWSLFMEVLG